MTSMAELPPGLRTSLATWAVYCRQHSTDGNIAVMHRVAAARTIGQHVLGAEEFDRWETWQAPEYMVVNRALDGGEPGHG